MIPRNRRLWLILGVSFILGIAAVAFASQIPWHPGEKMVEGIGVALFVAALLGATVDTALKTDLVRDVFQAAFRYVLPPELKDEVARIINYKFMCIKHESIIIISHIDSDLVKVELSHQRRIRNVTAYGENFQGLIAVDEWQHPEAQSSVEKCVVEYGGKTYTGAPMVPGGAGIGLQTESIMVRAGEELLTVTKGQEIHRRNSLLLMAFRVPTLNPVVTINLPDDLNYSCTFSVPGERIEVSRIYNRNERQGTQFPGQSIVIRWWPKTASPSVGT